MYRETKAKIADSEFVSSINNGDYLKVQGVDLSLGGSSIEVNVAAFYG